jgi:asparagine synthase (glutamine-hydrolysing)
MHVWVVGLGAQLDPNALTDALQDATRELRMLEPVPSWTFGPHRDVVAAGVHTVTPALGPRKYVSLGPDAATFFTGLPVDPEGAIEAHRADHLLERWDELHTFLEGHFVAVRLHREGPTTAEVVVDPVGLEQVYVVDVAGGTLLSNSVRVLDQVAGLSGLDPLGLSLLAAVGWVGSDRTLRAGVRVLGGGQRLRWLHGRREPVASSYFSSRELITPQSWRLSSTAADRLGEQLVSMVRTLGRQFGGIECTLTGGRDSRLLAGLTLASGATHEFYTVGHPAGGDMIVAQRLAQELGLRHRVVPATDDDVITSWAALATRQVAVTDGLVSLKEIGGRPVHVDRLSVDLQGFGGGIARSPYMAPRDLLALKRPGAVERLPARWVKPRGGLVSGAGRELATASVKAFIISRLDDGVRRDDLADHFLTFDNVPGWCGGALRRRADQVDYFQPLCSRPWIATAFSIRALSRFSEPLHHDLLRRLDPRLHALPFVDAYQWRPQAPLGTLTGTAVSGLKRRLSRRFRPPITSRPKQGTVFKKHLWLEGTLDQLRDVCLGVTDPVFWEIVDRRRLEQLLSPMTDAGTRTEHWPALMAIATAAYYSAATSATAGVTS